MKMIKEFNQIAMVVPTEILEEKSPSARAKVIARYIQVKSSSIANTHTHIYIYIISKNVLSE